MSIPLAFLSKMGSYQVQLGDAEVKVKVITDPSVLNEKLAEFESLLVERRVVGFHSEYTNRSSCFRVPWIMLSTADRCLVIDLRRVSHFHEGLKKFMTDKTICFVASRRGWYNCRFVNHLDLSGVVDLCELAATVLKNPRLEHASLEVLVAAVGFDATKMLGQKEPIINWNARVFSEEDMKFVVHNAYYSYALGDKLLAML